MVAKEGYSGEEVLEWNIHGQFRGLTLATSVYLS